MHEPKLYYQAGDIDAFHMLDIDIWSYFEATSLVKDLGNVKFSSSNIWWKHLRLRFEEG